MRSSTCFLLRRGVAPAVVALALAAVPSLSHAQPAGSRSAPRVAEGGAGDTTTLRAASAAIFSAISRGDTAALRRRLGAELRWVVATRGTVIDRDRLLAAASRPASGALPVTIDYALDSVTTWRHGDVATAEYRLTDRRTFRNHTNEFLSRASDVFVWRPPHGWRLVRHTQAWIIGVPALLAVADSALLAPFVGRYDRGAGYIDDVHFRDGHLVAQSTLEALLGAPGAHLHPVSENTFSPEGIAPMIVFERDAEGRVTAYVQQEPDGTIVRARRLFAPP